MKRVSIGSVQNVDDSLETKIYGTPFAFALSISASQSFSKDAAAISFALSINVSLFKPRFCSNRSFSFEVTSPSNFVKTTTMGTVVEIFSECGDGWDGKNIPWCLVHSWNILLSPDCSSRLPLIGVETQCLRNMNWAWKKEENKENTPYNVDPITRGNIFQATFHNELLQRFEFSDIPCFITLWIMEAQIGVLRWRKFPVDIRGARFQARNLRLPRRYEIRAQLNSLKRTNACCSTSPSIRNTWLISDDLPTPD